MGSRWILSRHCALLPLHGWLVLLVFVVVFLGMEWSILGHAWPHTRMHNYHDIHCGPNFDGGGGGGGR